MMIVFPNIFVSSGTKDFKFTVDPPRIKYDNKTIRFVFINLHSLI